MSARPALVPELYDLLVAMLPRMQSRALRPTWAGYLYTNYYRDLVGTRPSGEPRASTAAIEKTLDDYAREYDLRPRPKSELDD